MHDFWHILTVVLIGGFFVILFASNADETKKLMGASVDTLGGVTKAFRGYATGNYPA